MKSDHLKWQPNELIVSAAAPVVRTLTELKLTKLTTFPRAGHLNSLCVERFEHQWPGPKFVDQASLDSGEARYYEQIIAQDGCIPTREDSWHDCFNACIWMQFPKTKHYLNALHVQDINNFGVHPRTARRNHVTHFDECGVVLAIPRQHINQGNEILQQLATHQWKQAMYHQRELWQSAIFPFVFGHANLEMMLNPFIGLTGKWLAVLVDENFENFTAFEQTQHLDRVLLSRIQQLDDFIPARLMPPLPILGVPGWWSQQTETFYGNTEYFRPQPKGKGPTPQLPLSLN